MQTNNSSKISALFVFIAIGFIIFLSTHIIYVIKERKLPSLTSKNTTKPLRGDIISADGYHISSTQKLYKASINNNFLPKHNRKLFAKLFALYSGVDEKKILEIVEKAKGYVVLSYKINSARAQHLKQLRNQFNRMQLFQVPPEKKGTLLQGLNINESGETRIYPYGDLLTPVVGYIQKYESNGYTLVKGIKGLEKRYEGYLISEKDGRRKGKRDVHSNIILNKDSITDTPEDGMDLHLHIPLALQKRIESLLSKIKKELQAKEIMVSIMNSKNGHILSTASSNRFNPQNIKRVDYPSLNANIVEYGYEPGSVLKPLVFSLLLEENLVNPYDLINTHGGKYKIKHKTITDEHKYDWLSAENIIVYSSNIGISILAQKLSPISYHEGLRNFGLTQKSSVDLPYESFGDIPSISRLSNEIYKATVSYGYGLHANPMQLLYAYNLFNNSGHPVTPRIVSHISDRFGKKYRIRDEIEHPNVISAATAKRMKKILIKAVLKGTGTKAIYDGLEIGGKTGTAYMVEKGLYVSRYHTSFYGFANDEKSNFTIGVTVIDPKRYHFASKTAVPTFRRVVEILVEEEYLVPNDLNPS